MLRAVCFDPEVVVAMGEEVKISDYDGCEDGRIGEGDEERVLEWELGLPDGDDLTPLSQSLIPPELASAFSIAPEPARSMLEVNRASMDTMSSLRGQFQALSSSNAFNFKSFDEDPLVVEVDDVDLNRESSDLKKVRRIIESGGAEEADSAVRTDTCNDDPSAKTTLKRPRLVWTPQLHKRFVEVVAHLGIKNAVPKTIMQLMNVEGLTRENVASHLQKYRLYLKRMQGLSNEGPSSSDPLFASTPVPQSLNDSGASGQGPLPIPMQYPAPPHMMPLPMLGMAHGHGHMGIPVGNPVPPSPYNMLHQRSGNKFGSC